MRARGAFVRLTRRAVRMNARSIIIIIIIVAHTITTGMDSLRNESCV